ncbi:MAG: M56 family metallopeptidase [Oscillospiraceae bacterium]|nr:M56 family metallopeptidase [Oscillospiraceae bacterium]
MNVLVTSSVLIAVIFAVRALFRNRISRAAQYALWLLVLVRLLVPASLPALPVSVLNVGQETRAEISAAADGLYTGRVTTIPAENAGEYGADETWYSELSDNGEEVTYYTGKTDVKGILKTVWAAGAIAFAAWLAAANIAFFVKLRRGRRIFETEGCDYRVYVCGGIKSPCLAGILRPAIYITESAAADENILRHVIAHESAHAEHFDNLWSLLRGVCLALYWFDPFVWAAAFASRRDCELACDEAAIKTLGESERVPYGRTLLSLAPKRVSAMLITSPMSWGGKRMRERVERIVQNGKRKSAAALAAVLVIASAAALCTFTGAVEAKTAPEQMPAVSETTQPTNTAYTTDADQTTDTAQATDTQATPKIAEAVKADAKTSDAQSGETAKAADTEKTADADASGASSDKEETNSGPMLWYNGRLSQQAKYASYDEAMTAVEAAIDVDTCMSRGDIWTVVFGTMTLENGESGFVSWLVLSDGWTARLELPNYAPQKPDGEFAFDAVRVGGYDLNVDDDTLYYTAKLECDIDAADGTSALGYMSGDYAYTVDLDTFKFTASAQLDK